MSTTKDKNYMDYWLKFAGTAVTVLITIIISMTGFWMMIGKDYVTRDEARVIIEREMEQINVSLNNHSSVLNKIDNSIQKNTDTIVDLKLSLNSLSSLKAMEKRVEYLELEVRGVKETQIRSTESIKFISKINDEISDIKKDINNIKNSIQ